MLDAQITLAAEKPLDMGRTFVMKNYFEYNEGQRLSGEW